MGRLKQDRWEDATGKSQTRIKIVAEHVEFKPVFKRDEDSTATSAAETVVHDEELLAEAVF